MITVEPEEEIPIDVAVSELESVLKEEKKSETILDNYLKTLVNAK